MATLGQHRLSGGARFPDRRAAPRFAFDARLEIVDPVAQKQITGRVTVLSEKGCFGRMQAPLTQRAVVQVQIVKDETIFETWARATPNHPGFGNQRGPRVPGHASGAVQGPRHVVGWAGSAVRGIAAGAPMGPRTRARSRLRGCSTGRCRPSQLRSSRRAEVPAGESRRCGAPSPGRSGLPLS